MLVYVDEPGFLSILARVAQPLVLTLPPGKPSRKCHRYAVSYQGFVFMTDSKEAMLFEPAAVLVEVKNLDYYVCDG